MCQDTCGNFLQGRREVGGLDRCEDSIPQDDKRQGQSPDGHYHQRHEVGCQEHVRKHSYACKCKTPLLKTETQKCKGNIDTIGGTLRPTSAWDKREDILMSDQMMLIRLSRKADQSLAQTCMLKAG